jgi:protocatechuate 3,4-dioxygenase beta subunit
VPPGSYYLQAARAGHLTVQYGQRHASERGLVVKAEPGAVLRRVDIALPRGAVVSGRIVDDLGEPYPGVRVDLLGLRYDTGKRVAFLVGGATTDDLGQFRMAGVSPGRYYLMATSSETWRTAKGETFGFGSTYYPGVPIGQAQLITVGVSEVKSEMSFALQSGRAARLRGRVVRETGEPVPNAFVGLSISYGSAIAAGGRSTRSAGDGSFEFRDVPTGTYRVGDQEIAVAGADIDDLVMTVKTGSTVTGTVVTEDGNPPPFGPSGIRVNNLAPEGQVLPRVASVGVDDTWSFKMTNLGGKFVFRVSGLPDGWMLGAVRLGDRDVTDVPWDVPTGSKEFSDLKVVITRREGRVQGTVLDDTGQPTAEASVVLFSEDAQHWFPYSRLLHSVRPGADGRFSIRGLPAGTYRAVARDYIEPGQHEDAEFLESIRDEGVRIVLGEGASETVTLRVR